MPIIVPMEGGGKVELPSEILNISIILMYAYKHSVVVVQGALYIN